jgi:hypothetical protein
MATQEQLAASALYANIMAEVKYRTDAIDAGTGGKLPLSAPLIREFCYLQLRMICELIALGCLVAHGDIKAAKSKAMMKQWKAETIMNTLGELHPDFFPLAASQGALTGGVHSINITNPPVMTKADLLALYVRCGGVLHKGSLKKLMKEQMPLQVNFPEITAKAQKIHDLLAIHLVPMLGGDMTFICVLRNADDRNNVQVTIAERAQPPQSVLDQEQAATPPK